MDCGNLSLHPYRKRKFFGDLAELFNEQPRSIHRIEDVFPAVATSLDTSANESHQATASEIRDEPVAASDQPVVAMLPLSSPSEPDEDSFEYVDFDKSRASLDSSSSFRSGLHSQSSVYDSMQDSLLYLPPSTRGGIAVAIPPHGDMSAVARDVRLSQPTILSIPLDGSTRRVPELIDYYDLDRYCEVIPCWARENQSSCTYHTEPIRRPMLLFCLQALDEFIAATSIMCGEDWLVMACRVARIVFASMWEQDVRNVATRGGDVVLSDYVCEKTSLPGVSVDVWKVIDACWLKHKQNFLHHQELFFSENNTSEPSLQVEQWHRVRQLLQIYGLRPSQARHLIAEGALTDAKLPLSEHHMELVAHGFPSVVPIEVGLKYLHQVNKSSADTTSRRRWERNIISQAEWKQAFRAIQGHLTKWSRHVQVFPCGSFSRGAAFGSVVDMLVALPESDPTSCATAPVDQVLEVLHRATVIQQDSDSLWKLSAHRAIAIIPYKTSRLLLDVKVYRRPQSWFALLYFTGPETFSRSYFSSLLKRPLDELSVVDFEHIYERAVEQLGLEVVSSIDSEKDLFDLIKKEYLLALHRV